MNAPTRRVDVVFAPGVVAHRGTVEELLHRALSARGLTGELTFTTDTAELERATLSAARRGEASSSSYPVPENPSHPRGSA
ncbi:hypothetical protein ACH47B_31590 [Rhodococcus sp. NPDC019627]|uniref:hypothetical protein n=1 Tax=unclassified Rhodococcus (in: high G+C Gram-positive bacteria) TaxID=192944 RepID=UPI0033F01D0D